MSQFPVRYEDERLDALYETAVQLTSADAIRYYETIFENMAEFYGIIPLHKVYEILTGHYGEMLSGEAFLAVCEYERHAQKMHYYIFGAEEYDPDCTDPPSAPMDRLLAHEVYVEFDDTYDMLMQLKAGKPWFIPPKKAFTGRAGYWQNVNAAESEAIVDFLKKQFGLSKKHAENAFSDMSLALASERRDFYEVLDQMQRYTGRLPLEKVRAFIPYYIAWSNKSRAGFNNGYTPEELEALREEYGFTTDTRYLTSLELDEAKEAERSEKAAKQAEAFSNIQKTLAGLMKNDKKPAVQKAISRNALCPCGSGKKYKRCCGKDKK